MKSERPNLSSTERVEGPALSISTSSIQASIKRVEGREGRNRERRYVAYSQGVGRWFNID